MFQKFPPLEERKSGTRPPISFAMVSYYIASMSKVEDLPRCDSWLAQIENPGEKKRRSGGSRRAVLCYATALAEAVSVLPDDRSQCHTRLDWTVELRHTRDMQEVKLFGTSVAYLMLRSSLSCSSAHTLC